MAAKSDLFTKAMIGFLVFGVLGFAYLFLFAPHNATWKDCYAARRDRLGLTGSANEELSRLDIVQWCHDHGDPPNGLD